MNVGRKLSGRGFQFRDSLTLGIFLFYAFLVYMYTTANEFIGGFEPENPLNTPMLLDLHILGVILMLKDLARDVPGNHPVLGICRVSHYLVLLGPGKIIKPSKFNFFKVKYLTK